MILYGKQKGPLKTKCNTVYVRVVRKRGRMANFKVKISKDFAKILREVKRKFSVNLPERLKAAIRFEVQEGRSPVRGKRFEIYSDSYKRAIRRGKYSTYGKRVRPINLKLSGKMMRSIKIRDTAKGFTLFMSDAKAKYHNEGTGKIPRRPIMPRHNEQFSRRIDKLIEKDLEDIVKRLF